MKDQKTLTSPSVDVPSRGVPKPTTETRSDCRYRFPFTSDQPSYVTSSECCHRYGCNTLVRTHTRAHTHTRTWTYAHVHVIPGWCPTTFSRETKILFLDCRWFSGQGSFSFLSRSIRPADLRLIPDSGTESVSPLTSLPHYCLCRNFINTRFPSYRSWTDPT